MSENQVSGYTVHAFSASGALLGLDGVASAGQSRTGLTGDAAGKSLFVRTGFRAGNKSRTRVRFYVVTDPCGYREAHGRPAGGGLVRYLPTSEGQRAAFAMVDAVWAAEEDEEPVKAPEAVDAEQKAADIAERVRPLDADETRPATMFDPELTYYADGTAVIMRARNQERSGVTFGMADDVATYAFQAVRWDDGGADLVAPHVLHRVEPVSAPQKAAEPVTAPAPRTSAAESPRGPRVTVKTSTGAERVNDTTPGRLTVGADNPKGEPVYVKTLPERHHVHRGRTVADVFGRDGYWFTVPGNFPASLPEEFYLSRTTLAVFQSPDVVPGALMWVVRETTGTAANLATSAESRRAAVRSALARLSTLRMKRARAIVENRAAINSRPAPAPVRVSAGDAGWVVHVRCACEHLDDAENFPSAASAARQWVNQDPGTPWELCAHSPRAFTSIAAIRYTITGTGRDATGEAVIAGMDDAGNASCLWLSGARENSL